MSRRLGFCAIGLVVLLLLSQPFLAPYDPRSTDPARALEEPGRRHPLGTDGVGRDVMARVAAGAWSSLLVGVVALVISSTIGVAVGILAGAGSRWTDRFLSSVVDLLLAFPRYVLLLNLSAILVFPSVATVGLVIGLTSWMRTARLVRTEVLSLRGRAYIEAAHAAGARPVRVLARHLGPHVLGLVTESAGLRFAAVVASAATLDFLGLGLPADAPTWGRLILDGQSYVDTAPWITFSAVGILCLTSVGLVLVSERRPVPR